MRSRKFMAIALAAVTMGTLAAFASCGSDKTTVTLSGSTSVQPLMEKLGAAFEEAHGDIEIVVNGGGSGVGVSDTQTDKNDFRHGVSRAEGQRNGVKAEKIATDGIAIIVNTGCTLDNVTPDEVYGLYAEGTAIGTVNAAISRESGSGTRGAFDELVKNSEGKTLDKAESFAKCVQTQNSTGAVITQISTAGKYQSHRLYFFGLSQRKCESVEIQRKWKPLSPISKAARISFPVPSCFCRKRVRP